MWPSLIRRACQWKSWGRSTVTDAAGRVLGNKDTGAARAEEVVAIADVGTVERVVAGGSELARGLDLDRLLVLGGGISSGGMNWTVTGELSLLDHMVLRRVTNKSMPVSFK